MAVADRHTAHVVVGAIRLALEAAANDEAAIRTIRLLVDQAPPTSDSERAPVDLLLDTVRADRSNLRLEVVVADPPAAMAAR